MPEVAHAGGDHCNPGRVGGSDRFTIADRPAGVDDGCDPGLNRRLNRIDEREKGIGLRHRSHGLLASSPGDNAHAINPVRLPNADAHRGWQGARSCSAHSGFPVSRCNRPPRSPAPGSGPAGGRRRRRRAAPNPVSLINPRIPPARIYRLRKESLSA